MSPAFDLIPFLVPCAIVVGCLVAMILHKG